jgi:hypothetical protein
MILYEGDEVPIYTGDPLRLRGRARVVKIDRDTNAITLDSLPEGTTKGDKIGFPALEITNLARR